MGGNYSVVGRGLPRIDGIEKGTGTANFTHDIALPGMLYGKILRSPHPHARILSVDTSKADSYPGVKATLTIRDCPRIRYGQGTGPYAALYTDEYIIDEKVYYVGDKVAAVAATSEEVAEEALELIDVQYEVLPSLLDPIEAMKPDAPLLHDTPQNLVMPVVKIEWGNIEEGFAQADYVFEDDYETQRVQHCTMETHVCVANWDSSGRLTMWTSAQGPYRIRWSLSRALGLPVSKIRVIVPHVGGGFGSKGAMMYEPVCALLAKKAGRPVKLECSRQEEFDATITRHPVTYNLKTGVKKDGTLTARQGRAYFNKGAYANLGPVVVYYTADNFATFYRCPNLKLEAYLVYTNYPSAGAYRGFGDPQTFFAVESQMDMIAEKLGLDPTDLRLKNILHTGDKASDGLTITSCGLAECIEKGRDRIGWKERRKAAGGVGDIRRRGIGMAVGMHKTGVKPAPEMSSALVKINEDGTINLLVGATDVGTGAKTVLAQICAEGLGIKLEDVIVTSSDTDITPFDEKGAIASRTTYVTGGAVKKAAADARAQILEKAAKMLDARVEDLELKDRRAYVRGTPDRGTSIADVVMFSQYGGEEKTIILGRGSHEPEGKAPYFMAQFIEVEVDMETGIVKPLRIVAAQDVGFAINPAACEGQMEGALQHGLGYGLTEEMISVNGKTINDNFIDYRTFGALDMPPIETIMVETIDPTGPYGAKGVGEGTMVPTAAAISNAIYNATGVRIKELPITPEKILMGLGKIPRR